MKEIINLLLCCLLFISCVNRPRTLGIDISHYNKITDCDWQYFKDANVKFVFIKASEGASYKDPLRYKHFNKASNYNLYIGAYHFFRGDIPAEDQYKNYDKATEDMSLSLLPCIDYEKDGFGKESEVSRIQNLIKLNELFSERAGVYPIIYCNAVEYIKLKTLLPHNEFWIESKSPDFGIGVMKQIVRKVNGKEIDFNYCSNINNIIFSD